jgi:ATP-binding cassette subfamily F protein 3
MDEPTTHLDVGSIDALIGALKQYHGTLIFISHDVHFIRAIATSVLHVTGGANRTGGKLTFYPGDYDYYLDKSKATSARIALTADRDAPELNGLAAASKLRPDPTTDGFGVAKVRKQNGSSSRKQKEQKRLEAESRNAVAKARREKEKRVHELETKIAALEGQQKELAAALENPAAYTPGGHATAINRDLSALSHDLARLTAEWESVTATVSAP